MPTIHLRIFKNINLYLNPLAFQFIEGSDKTKCRCNGLIRKMGKYA